MLSAFHSAVIDVTDFESGVRDYARLLGREPDWRELDTAEGMRSAFFSLANTSLEIREAAAEPDRLAGIRLDCEDIVRFGPDLEANGISVGSGIRKTAELANGEGARSWISTALERRASRSIPVELVSDETGCPAGGIALNPDSGETGSGGGSDGSRRADSGVDPRSAVRALDHVVIFSADIEATRDFYAGLGIRLALDRSFESRGVRLLFFRIGGVTIEIGGRLDAVREPDGEDRFGGLAWQVVDLDAIHSRLLGDRFDISGIREGNKPGTRVCTVRDPVHGVPTLLIEPVS